MPSMDYPIRCQCDRCPWACDLHVVPVVCVCNDPAPEGDGQCRTCKRPYKPQVPGFNECRDAWIAQLAREAA